MKVRFKDVEKISLNSRHIADDQKLIKKLKVVDNIVSVTGNHRKWTINIQEWLTQWQENSENRKLTNGKKDPTGN